MWLVYLLFRDGTEIKSYHVRATNKVEVREVLDKAEQRGPSPDSLLVEYAVFYAHATIQPKEQPNFHCYGATEWLTRWTQMKL